jgi:hypothetical protein
VTLTPHPLLVPRSKNSVDLYVPLLSLRAFVAYKKDETYLKRMHEAPVILYGIITLHMTC